MTRLLVLLAIAACGSRPTLKPGEQFRDRLKLLVDLDQSPTGGPTFDFCPTPKPDEPHLGNAAWLAFLSANEYAHMYYLSSTLGALGFESGLDWPQCSTDLRVVRGFEDRNRGPIVAASRAGSLKSFLTPHATSWGPCATAWFDTHYDGAQFPAAAFEKYLVQTQHPGESVEFFSGGKIADGRVFTEGSTQVTFMRHKTLPLVIIAFRGTEPTRQWSDLWTDMKAWKKPLAPGWGDVHAGFRDAFESIGGVMRAKLDEYKDQRLSIWVTGHSLGGGLATLMAAEILRRNDAGERFDLRGVYTFGSPRVGNKAFRAQLLAAAARHGTQLVRFRNGDDIITALPRVAEFEHVGRVVHLRENKTELLDRDPPYGGLGSFADHDIAGWVRPKKAVSGYYRRIRAAAAITPGRCL